VLKPGDTLDIILVEDVDTAFGKKRTQKVVEFSFEEVRSRLLAPPPEVPNDVLGGRFSRSVSIMLRNIARGTDPRGREIDAEETLEKVRQACLDLPIEAYPFISRRTVKGLEGLSRQQKVPEVAKILKSMSR
jgi:hypothetical protein